VKGLEYSTEIHTRPAEWSGAEKRVAVVGTVGRTYALYASAVFISRQLGCR